MLLEIEETDLSNSFGNADFAVRFHDLLPDLRARSAAQTAENYLLTTIKNVAVKLFELAEIGSVGGTIRYSGAPGIYEIAVEFKAENAAKFLFETAVEIVASRMAGKDFSFADKIAEARQISLQTELGPSTRAIVEAAEKRGIPWFRENANSAVQFGYGKNLRRIRAAMTDATSSMAAGLVQNKDLTKQRLAKFFVPVPHGTVVENEAQAVAAFLKINAPVVVKPLDGRQGKGVSVNLKTESEVLEAFRFAAEFSKKIIVETYFEGKNYRLLIIGGKLSAASERIAPGVTGDGKLSIRELIELENQNPQRGGGHEKPLTKIKIDAVLEQFLNRANLNLASILPVGEEIILSAAANLSTGATARRFQRRSHPNRRRPRSAAPWRRFPRNPAAIPTSKCSSFSPHFPTANRVLETPFFLLLLI